MKLFISLFLLLCIQSYAASRPHLVCLGAEEVYIHKNKIGGAYYKLNQEMISLLLQLNESAKMSPKLQKKVCAQRFTSMAILREILTSKKPIFKTSYSNKNLMKKSTDNFSISEIKGKSFTILINFLTRLQAQYSDINCLKKRLPEIVSFYENAQFLLSEIGLEKTIDTIKNKKAFFDKIQKLPGSPKC